MQIKELITSNLKSTFPEAAFEFSEYRNEFIVKVDKKFILKVCEFLKKNPDLEFKLLEDVTAVDWATRKNRFTVVYHVFSLKNKFRIVIKADLEEPDYEIESVSSVWRAANWYERECFDMYGIKFKNHPDLRRMYMPEDFEYYPLRKDFPLMGIPGSLPLPKK